MIERPEIDFSADAPVVTDEQLGRITRLALALLDERDEIEALEGKLKAAKERLAQLETKDLPDAMDAAQMSEFKLTNGKKIIVKPVVNGNIPKDRFEEGLSWLRSNDHDGLIKREIAVVVKLGKGQDAEGNKLVRYFAKLKTLIKLGVLPTDKPSVNYQTFSAWAREMKTEHEAAHVLEGKLEGCPFCEGEERLKALGIYVGRKAEVK